MLLSHWNGSLKPYIPEGQGLKAIMEHATDHFSTHSKIPSPFASVATSLLQILKMASKMSNPQIALIDLHHPSMVEPHKVLHAEKLLVSLQKHQQALWARYQGTSGMFFPISRILQCLTQYRIHRLLEHPESCNLAPLSAFRTRGPYQ